jgi:ubiquinone/menaquinone biosynthesis C-methylase UbiE
MFASRSVICLRQLRLAPPSAARSFSGYEDYSKTSSDYDQMRRPLGLDDLGNCFEAVAARRGKQVSQLQLLDVGCGTGNYLGAVHEQLGSCTGLEFNEGMLSQAMAKGMAGVDLHQGSALDLSRFDEGAFDVVIMTQVLHHLDSDVHEQALAQMSRVLPSGGALWLSTQTPHQHMNGFWWTPIIPKAAALVAARFSGLHELTAQLMGAGFADISAVAPPETLVTAPHYLQAFGPFDDVFRNCDSTWAAATSSELKAGQTWWRSVIDAGGADEFLAEREALRTKVGMTTSVTAVKA